MIDTAKLHCFVTLCFLRISMPNPVRLDILCTIQSHKVTLTAAMTLFLLVSYLLMMDDTEILSLQGF